AERAQPSRLGAPRAPFAEQRELEKEKLVEREPAMRGRSRVAQRREHLGRRILGRIVQQLQRLVLPEQGLRHGDLGWQRVLETALGPGEGRTRGSDRL